MAFNFIKKVFSFGRTEAGETVQPAQQAQELPPPVASEQVDPAPLQPEPAVEPETQAVEVEPEAQAVEAEPEAQTAEAEPEAQAVEAVPEVQPVEAVPEAQAAEVVDEVAPPPPAAQTQAPAPEIAPQAPAVVEEAPAKAEKAEPPRPVPPPSEKTGRVKISAKVEQAVAPAPVEPNAPAPKLTWFQRLRQGLSRSSGELAGNIAGIFTRRKLDNDTLQDLEDVLIRADLGVELAMRVTDALASGRFGKDVSGEEVRAIMAAEVEKVLKPVALPLELDLSHKPHVILVVGVNGTGKTTTIGKLAAKLTEGGLSVTLAAGDTFRAAAIEQLKIWGERTGSPVISSKPGADAAGLAYEAFEKAKQAGSDVLIIDTAGRLQNRAELMAELEKIVRVLGKLDPQAPHTVLQTVDATTGQNALNQVEIFRNVAGVNGLVMTKLDGTARGGILVAIAARHKLPVYFIGVGEQVDDLEPFSAGDFAKAIAGVA